jgi:hypothetical protein
MTPEWGQSTTEKKKVIYVHQDLVLSPTCAPAKVGVNKKKCDIPIRLK